jgi:DivIVA domain-containing protein
MKRFWSRVFAHFAQRERQRTDDDYALDVPDGNGDEQVELTAYDVVCRRFRRQLFGGLRPDEVTAFLEQVAGALHSAQSRHIEIEAQLRLSESDIQTLGIKPASAAPSEHAEPEDDAPAASRLQVLRSTALQEVEALLHDAQARAEQLVADANVTVESILTAARDQEASLRNELDRLAESRLRILDDLWTMLNSSREWLASVDPRRGGPEESEGRLDRVA